jgi:hypothetical protein
MGLVTPNLFISITGLWIANCSKVTIVPLIDLSFHTALFGAQVRRVSLMRACKPRWSGLVSWEQMRFVREGSRGE